MAMEVARAENAGLSRCFSSRDEERNPFILSYVCTAAATEGVVSGGGVGGRRVVRVFVTCFVVDE